LVAAICYWFDMRHNIISRIATQIQEPYKFAVDIFQAFSSRTQELDDVSKVSIIFITLIIIFTVKILTLKRLNIEDTEALDIVPLDADERPSYLG
jgi:hypothetical protein